MTMPSEHFREMVQFERFRGQLIDFFRLPIDTSETTFRVTLRKASQAVFQIYLDRATRLDELADGAVRMEALPELQYA